MNMLNPIGAGRVRIDGTYGLDPREASDEAEAKGIGPHKPAAPAAALGAATEIVSSQDRLIAAAAQVDEVDAKAVDEARALLKSGGLDTPEAAERAARAILEQGL
jgi:hypothetical protein